MADTLYCSTAFQAGLYSGAFWGKIKIYCIVTLDAEVCKICKTVHHMQVVEYKKFSSERLDFVADCWLKWTDVASGRPFQLSLVNI